MTARIPLPEGTIIALEGGARYQITGAPIGYGGSSIIYNVRKLLPDGSFGGILFTMKECYPVLSFAGISFMRDIKGEVVPQQSSVADQTAAAVQTASHLSLAKAKEMFLREAQTTQEIYESASRILPIRETAIAEQITLPGGDAHLVHNALSIMDSLSNKGKSLHAFLEEEGSFSAAVSFQVMRHLLDALEEIHTGAHPYVHLDIQDSNIFLHGSLQDDSEQLTLIDFGSARKLYDGRTQPQEIHTIFSTDGFTPPEILQCWKNGRDSIALTPVADLYSAGCVLYLMLTGNKLDPGFWRRYEDKNPGGGVDDDLSGHMDTILSRKDIRRLKKKGLKTFLVPRLQSILSRALAPDPAKRYQTAQEMRADVADFIQALQPFRADLAGVEYDAFISYRHAPLDRAAAYELQTCLEHYHAPRDVSRSRRPFRRVFLDEGELSSCADYGAQLESALKNAGWLIVVCSPETTASRWVNEEIRTFLQYHDPSRVLAMLISGTPEESFPALLRGDGRGHGEVLAASLSDAGYDSSSFSRTLSEAESKAVTQEQKEAIRRRQLRLQERAQSRAIHKDAVLKLTAPMLGTTFDSLKQRHRNAAMKKGFGIATVALAGALLFTLYALHQNHLLTAAQQARLEEEQAKAEAQQEALDAQAVAQKEQEEKEQAQKARIDEQQKRLEKQAQYVAVQAKTELENGDPIGAMKAVLASIPEEAVLTYGDVAAEESDGTVSGENSRKEAGNTASAFTLSADAREVLIEGTHSYIAPDTAAQQPAIQRQYESASGYVPYRYFADTDNHVLISFDNYTITVWDTETGEVRRTIPIDTYINYISDEAFDQKRHTITYASQEKIFCYDYLQDTMVYALSPSMQYFENLGFSPDGERLLAYEYTESGTREDYRVERGICIFDRATGEKIRRILLDDVALEEDDEWEWVVRRDLSVGEEKSFPVYAFSEDGNVLVLGIYRSAAGLAAADVNDSLLVCHLQTGECSIQEPGVGSFIHLFLTNGKLDIITENRHGHYMEDEFISDEIRNRVCCWNLETDTIEWENRATSQYFSTGKKIMDMGDDTILALLNRRILHIAQESGVILHDWPLASSVRAVWNDSDRLDVLTSDGSMHSYSKTDFSESTQSSLFPADLNVPVGSEKDLFFGFGDKTDIVEYAYDLYDPGWEESTLPGEYYGEANGYTCRRSDEELLVCDQSGKVCRSVKVKDIGSLFFQSYKPFFVDEEAGALYLITNNSYYEESFGQPLMQVDLQTGDYSFSDLPVTLSQDFQINSLWFRTNTTCAVIGARIITASLEVSWTDGDDRTYSINDGRYHQIHPSIVLSAWEAGWKAPMEIARLQLAPSMVKVGEATREGANNRIYHQLVTEDGEPFTLLQLKELFPNHAQDKAVLLAHDDAVPSEEVYADRANAAFLFTLSGTGENLRIGEDSDAGETPATRGNSGTGGSPVTQENSGTGGNDATVVNWMDEVVWSSSDDLFGINTDKSIRVYFASGKEASHFEQENATPSTLLFTQDDEAMIVLYSGRDYQPSYLAKVRIDSGQQGTLVFQDVPDDGYLDAGYVGDRMAWINETQLILISRIGQCYLADISDDYHGIYAGFAGTGFDAGTQRIITRDGSFHWYTDSELVSRARRLTSSAEQ